MSIKDRVLDAVAKDIPFLCDVTWSKIEPLCESPIETALGSVLLLGLRMCAVRDIVHLCSAADEEKLKDSGFLLMPQYPWRSYRIDWVLRTPKLKRPHVFIECDGHDFHERTADQALRDRSRDREVQEAGIPILRFTGREIYRDLNGCCVQVLDMVAALTDQQK